MKTTRKFTFKNIIIGIIFTLFFISFAVIFTVNFRPLYYYDIDYLQISEYSSYDKEVIIRNYDALIDYNSPFYKGELKFPDLTSSKEGLQHFVEVKNIFVAFYYIGLLSFILCLLIVLYKRKQKDYNYLLVSSLTLVLLPFIISLFAMIDFDTTFVLFHKIFFRNDYWIFDPRFDPIINLLPQTYFLHSLLMIILIILLGSISLFIGYMIKRGKK